MFGFLFVSFAPWVGFSCILGMIVFVANVQMLFADVCCVLL